jgi:hypothetical protein
MGGKSNENEEECAFEILLFNHRKGEPRVVISYQPRGL